MEMVLVPINIKHSPGGASWNMVSARERISPSKTNDVSPFRKYIRRERYDARAR